MVVDSNALIAILLGEDGSRALAEKLDSATRPFMSSFGWFETAVVIEAKKGIPGARLFNELVAELGIECIPFDQSQAEIAMDAWRRFGKGRHPAALNVGDCAAYALAKTLHQGLLFKGEDFSKTDVARA